MAQSGELLAERRIPRALAAFGGDVRRRRCELGLTQRAAAEFAGISQSHWSKIERGLHDLSIGQALRIQFALGAESIEGMLGRQPSALVLRATDHSRLSAAHPGAG
jgi:transcriptional regulator with XRE-family HTH domain